MKRTIGVVVLSALLVSTATFAFAASNAAGTSCKKVGVKAKSGATAVICAKVGKKLIWQKITPPKVISSPAPKPSQSKSASQSPTPTPSVSPSPTQSASSKPSPTPSQSKSNVASQDSYTMTVKAASWFYSFLYSVNGEKEALTSDAAHSRILVVPLGQPVKLNLTNNSDVVHGFWVPELGIDKEITPDVTTKVDFTPNKLGTFKGSCSVECGRGHSEMLFSIQVVSESDFLKYLSSL